MQRLTKREGKHTIRIRNEWRRHDIGWDKLAEYEDLEEQGLLLRLPCKMGDAVYLVDSSLKCVHTFEISDICINKYETLLRISYTGTDKQFSHWRVETKISKFGEWIFKTKEEAEKKLREMEV